MTIETLKLTINHILESGANDIRLSELCIKYAKEKCEEQRVICNNQAKITEHFLPSKNIWQANIEGVSILNANEPKFT